MNKSGGNVDTTFLWCGLEWFRGEITFMGRSTG